MYKVMIVDDDTTSLAIGRALLEGEYDVTLARSGLQALGFLENGEIPDLMLLDMVMPGINGLEVLKNLKNNDAYKDIPVVFLTGESQIGEQVKSYISGAADFIQKPVNRDMLRIKVQQQIYYMELKRENKRLREGLDALKKKFDSVYNTLSK